MFLVASSVITATAAAVANDDSITSNENNNTSNKQTLDENKYRLDLMSRSFVPPSGIHLNTSLTESSPDNSGNESKEEIYFLMQFRDIPNDEEKERLTSQGLTILDYIGGNTYIVSSSNLLNTHGAMSNTVTSDDNIRSVFSLDANDKISPEIKSGNVGEWALPKYSQTDALLNKGSNNNGKDVILNIHFHKDVEMSDAVSIIEKNDGKVLDTVHIIPSVTTLMKLDYDSIYQLAKENKIQFIGAVDPPLEPTNDNAKVAANVQPLSQAPYGLSGEGVTVLVYDAGVADATHLDFGTRIIETDPNIRISAHATHVAGTLGGDGTNSNGNDNTGNPNGGTTNQWAGMAPGINIRSFSTTGFAGDFYNGNGGDLSKDFTTAINNGIDLATMSLGNNVVPARFPCDQLGDYTSTAILIDNIVTGSINNQQLIYFEAAGNERALGAPCGNFGTISSPATAKNSIAVGATNSDDDAIAWFSSFGPTDDGRIKPDIMAPGCHSDLSHRIVSTGTNNDYRSSCGTSMASPAAAGSAALLVEQWRDSFGNNAIPLPQTIKAILLHTADDQGSFGPDYQFGWGILDAQAAIDLIRQDENTVTQIIQENIVGNGSPNTHEFYIGDDHTSEEIKVTLVWNDPPATLLAPQTLINDLDLRLVDPDGVEYLPFIMDPENPENAATAGIDRVNNVEMIVAGAKKGVWTVHVIGANIAQGPQVYALITPETQTEPPVPPQSIPVTVKITRVVQTDNPDGWPSGDGDYYAKVKIGHDGQIHQVDKPITGKDISPPDWSFTELIEIKESCDSLIPIKMELWDSDDFLNGKDDSMDINPAKNKKELDLVYNLVTQRWSGDISYPSTTSQGYNGGEKAKITFEISSPSMMPKQTPDWNKSCEIPDPDDGDPLVFSMTDKPVKITRNWPEQHESFLTEFDLFDTGKNVTLSRTLDDGTMTLFLDLNGDVKLSNGIEWLYDSHENVYQILSRPLIDSNQNGWFDYSDNLWNIAMIKDGDKYYHASELGIVAFNWSNYSDGHGDMFGENRQYSDCLYEGIYLYPRCMPVSDGHFAITSYNQNSILLNDGRVLDSFGSVMGYLDMSENNALKQIL